MATFIVRKAPGSSVDGSSFGPSMVMIHASNASSARSEGARDLGVPPSEVIVEPFHDSFWD